MPTKRSGRGKIEGFLMYLSTLSKFALVLVINLALLSPDLSHALLPKKKPANEQGGFSVVYEEGQGDVAEIAKILSDNDVFGEVVAGLNQVFILPRNIPIRFASCGEANAFYSSQDAEVVMCYELFQKFLTLLSDDQDSNTEKVGETVIEAAAFILFHEIGHCLTDQLELPVTGKEEDAVDDLAAVFSIEMGDVGESLVMSAIQGFAALADEEGYDNLAFEDEHSLTIQRVYNISCILYGSDTEKFQSIVTEELLPQSRAERCEHEFAQKKNSWDKLLKDHLRT